jgi:hypothetical protein
MRSTIDRTWTLMAGGALLLGAAGCSKPAALTPFESCEELEEYIEDLAVEEFAYRGSSSRGISMPTAGAPMADMALESGSGGDDDGGGSYSSTNTQEAGVDEADFVKNDGSHIFVIAGYDLAVIDAWPAEEMHEIARVQLEGYPEAMYHDGETIAVLSHLYDEAAPEGEGDVEMRDFVTKITLIDVSDRAAPTVSREVYVEGSLYDSRRVGDRLYLVTYRDLAEIPLRDTVMASDLARTEIKERVRETALGEWMPRRLVNDRAGSTWTLAQDDACACTDVYRPARDGGLEMMSVLALDMADPTSEVTGTSVLAGTGEVYATPDSLYLAVYEPDEGPFRVTSGGFGTRIHKFDLEGGPEHPAYEASGRVKGWTHSSFSMDEADDSFRIVTTRHSGNMDFSGDATGLYVLEQSGDELDEIGKVEGIAPGESVYAVRFTDEAAYVVTFLQIDPLFTIDLTDRYAPQVLGELEVTGFSTYLHPLDEGHLLAVGEAVDPSGVQISLFDVSDMTDPTLQDREIVETGWNGSEALYDHHAFNYYPPLELFALPITASPYWGEVDYAGLYMYDVDVVGGLEFAGAIDVSMLADPSVEEYYVQYCSQVRRSVMIEDVVYAVASGGIVAAAAETPDQPLAVLAHPDVGTCDQPWEWWAGNEEVLW